KVRFMAATVEVLAEKTADDSSADAVRQSCASLQAPGRRRRLAAPRWLTLRATHAVSLRRSLPCRGSPMSVWTSCLERLQGELAVDEFMTWLKPLQAEMRDGGLVVLAPNAFVIDTVRD